MRRKRELTSDLSPGTQPYLAVTLLRFDRSGRATATALV